MEESTFIILAYSFTVLTIALLCLATWLRARAVRRALNERGDA
jgi:hypothetical protein